MKKKNFMCIALSALIVSLCACGNAQPASTTATESTAAETTAVTTTAAETTTTTTTTTAAETEAAEAPALFEALNGTYDELFTVICAPEHDQISEHNTSHNRTDNTTRPSGRQQSPGGSSIWSFS